MTTNRTGKVQIGATNFHVGRAVRAKTLGDNSSIGKDARSAPYSCAEQVRPA
ncbi:MAG: hypothetical protein Q7U66_06145 [Methylobacter sp.]|nr:hypothetical protein [Methylobacter sp.]